MREKRRVRLCSRGHAHGLALRYTQLTSCFAMLGIIGGSGLDRIANLDAARRGRCARLMASRRRALTFGRLQGREVVFLPRHGPDHTIAPHRINYRANIWALHAQGVREVVAVAAVGGIAPSFAPGALVVPDQIIDYTHGRESTFFDGIGKPLAHIDFTRPFCEHAAAAAAARRQRSRRADPRWRHLCRHAGPAPGNRGRDQPHGARRRRYRRHDRHAGGCAGARAGLVLCDAGDRGQCRRRTRRQRGRRHHRGHQCRRGVSDEQGDAIFCRHWSLRMAIRPVLRMGDPRLPEQVASGGAIRHAGAACAAGRHAGTPCARSMAPGWPRRRSASGCAW